MTRPTPPNLTNVQWAWEFLRRNKHYRFFYARWKEACEGPTEITEEERQDIEGQLNKLGLWRPRFEPWIRAGLATGKRFIHEKTFDDEFYRGSCVEADWHYDPMMFMVTRWIDPSLSLLPSDQTPFARCAALTPKIFRPLSKEFLAFYQLGMVNCFIDEGPDADGAEEFFDYLKSIGDTEGLPDSYSVKTLSGWKPRPNPFFGMQGASEEEEREFAAARKQSFTSAEISQQLDGAPRAESHKVLDVYAGGKLNSFDLTVNLQFDLSLPLREQIAAADALLNEHLDRLPTAYRNSLNSGLPELQIANVDDTYPELVQLLDAYDAEEGDREYGQLAAAIRRLTGDKTLKAKDPEYRRLEKSFARATMLRESGYRSLAFLNVADDGAVTVDDSSSTP